MIKDPLRNPLTTLQQDIEVHWRRYLPRLTATLEQEGNLSEQVREAAALTEDAVLEAIAAGDDFWQAWERWREEWAFLPPEGSNKDTGTPEAHRVSDWQTGGGGVIDGGGDN